MSSPSGSEPSSRGVAGTTPRLDESELAELRTIRDLIRWGASRFAEAGLAFGHGTDNPLDEAVALVLHALYLTPDLPSSYLGSRVTERERGEVFDLLRERIEKRRPAAYLIGEAWFAGLSFYVDERVLIPRSPMAELIEQRFSPWLEADRAERILDLGTGSGCIAVACAHAFPRARIDAVDLSAAALEVAQINVARHGLEARVRLIQSDLFAELGGERYDLIVSNPPYVSAKESADLPQEYRHEPSLALEAGEAGLDVVVRILRHAPAHLTHEGILVVEVGASAPNLLRRFPQVPFVWPELARGGEGVFLLSAEQLHDVHPLLAWTGA